MRRASQPEGNIQKKLRGAYIIVREEEFYFVMEGALKNGA